jgi:hypothetical protein
MRPLLEGPTMLKKTLSYLNFVAGSTVGLMYSYKEIKREVKKLAATTSVRNEFEYVLVRLARGDYNNANGFDQLKNDFKFYKTIKNFHQ